MIHRSGWFLGALSLACACSAQWKPQPWPVLKHYDAAHLQEIALPLGGIGTGTVSLGGRGELRDWEVMNYPAKRFNTTQFPNDAPFFAIYTKEKDKPSQTLGLLGPIYDNEYLSANGRGCDNHGIPRFKNASFDAAYPFGQARLDDPEMPVSVTVKGFNPFIPGDTDNSSLPIAVLSYEVKNLTDHPVEVAVCGSIRNFVGCDGNPPTLDWRGPEGASTNRNEYKVSDRLRGIYFYSDGVPKTDAAWGTMALTTEEKEGVSFRTAADVNKWNKGLLSFWDDFSADGVLVEKYDQFKQKEKDPMASLAVKKSIAPHATESFTFFLTWNFPNRYAWGMNFAGNYYSGLYSNAWDAAEKVIPNIPKLESKTLEFVNAVCQSSYPEVIKEAALFNLAVLRSQTVFRIPSGHMMGWEGVLDNQGSCKGSCTHVWNYEVATPFLFADLAKTMRDVELNYATKTNGLMNFRAELPLSKAKNKNDAAADGQMGCVMKFYREWQLSGDPDYLKANYQQVKKVLSYTWTTNSWDANQDGVMEGCQHNTMDVNYYGPNPQMGFWYMGALRAAEEMAIAMKDDEFAKTCRSLFDRGSRWMDENLFNGSYYEHKITDPKTFEFIDMNNPKAVIPPYQLGKGCLVDQLVGQYMAHICGLGYLANPSNIQATSKSIMTNNFKEFSKHFNNMRSFVMGDERGLLMASWPKGRLAVPFPYFAEVMTGFEYSAAVEMIYEGQKEDAVTCIQAIRERHNGSKRNPFSEPECGHHYARSMASWAAIIAWSDFHYSGVDHSMSFTSNPGTYFWSNGYAWGTCTVGPKQATLKVLKGKLELQKFALTGSKPVEVKLSLTEGGTQTIKLAP